MKVISIEQFEEGFAGFVDDGKSYFPFIALKGEPVEREPGWPKSDYPDYEMFVRIMSKFDPGAWFLRNPLPIKSLTYEELNEVYCALHKKESLCETGIE
jgi:hypothetical protein